MMDSDGIPITVHGAHHDGENTQVSSAVAVSRAYWPGVTRVSKSGRHADARLHKIFHKLREMLAFERKTVKITSFNLI